jgi:membrane peptidoglycan carboxypeptidase
MALGSSEVRLLELTGAYNTLRNGGHFTPPVAILKVTSSRGEVLEQWRPRTGPQVLGADGEQIAYLLTDILSDNQARWYMFGRGNVMELPDGRPAAVKTGTSDEWRDSWAVGYTPDVTVGVWVGNNDNVPMQEIAGSNGAGLIWRDVMMSYHQGRPPQPFARPQRIVERQICAATGSAASAACTYTIGELFVEGEPPSNADVVYETVRVGGDGSCVAAAYTPPEEVREVRYAVYPLEFREWASNNGIPQPPTEICPPPQAPGQQWASLMPIKGVQAGDQVFIHGVARGPYQLEYRAADAPESWSLINQGIGEPPPDEGQGSSAPVLLGVWPTESLAPGRYTLRLRVHMPDGTAVDATQALRLE